MEILGRFNGRNGQITIAQERKTGARLYLEEGVKQSYVLPGGSPGLDYVRLMVRVLEGAPDIILFGCGGGALASELHNRGCRITVVDDNPISFEIARRYFWMPPSIVCEVGGMAEFLDAYDVFGGRAKQLYELGLAIAGVPGYEKELRVDIRPTVETGLGPILYATPITLRRTVGG